MSKFCIECGKPLREGAKFCQECGAKIQVNAEQPAEPVSRQITEPAQPVTQPAPELTADVPEQTEAVKEQAAEAAAPETELPEDMELVECELKPEESAQTQASEEIRSPVGALFGGAGSLISGFFETLRNKKALVLAAVLAVLWIVLGHLFVKGQTGSVTNILSWLTYARGGLTGGASGLIGGVLGKGLVGAGFGTLLLGGSPRCFSGIGHLIKEKSMNIGSLLIGFGLAGIAYAFMAGNAGTGGTMVGISGAALTLRAVTAKSGFLSSFAASLSAQKGAEGVRTVVPARFRGILTGAAVGFAVSAVLCGIFSLSMTGWIGYGVLLAAVITGIILSRAGNHATMRMFALLGAVSFSLWHILLIAAIPVHAESSGYWKYVKYWTDEDLLEDPIYDGRTAEGDAASGFHVHNQLIEHNIRGPYGDSPGQKGHQDCYGEYGDMFVTFSPLPNSKERYEVGESLSINVNLEADTSDHRLNPGGYVNIYLTWDPRSNPFASFREAGNGNDRIQPALDQSDGYTSLTEDFSGVFTQEIPAGNTGSYSHLYFCFHLVVQNGFINSFYEYEWVDTSTTGPVGAVTDTTTTGTTTVSTENTTIIQTVTQDAQQKPGLDSGVGILTEILTGGIGAVLGASAVGAAVSGKNKGNQKKKLPQVTYKMHVYKKFGDSIVPGETYQVFAAIVRYDGDRPRYQDELSSKIIIQDNRSEGFWANVDGFIKHLRRFSITVEPDTRLSDEATLSVPFILKGKGGTFIEYLTFKISKKRVLSLIYLKPDGSFAKSVHCVDYEQHQLFSTNQKKARIGLFMGDEPKTEICILVTGYAEQPNLTVHSSSSLLEAQVTGMMPAPENAPAEVQSGFLFRIALNNRSTKPNTIFGKFPEKVFLTLTATGAGKDHPVTSAVAEVELFPEGFFYDMTESDERQVSTDYIQLYTNELLDERHSALRPTEMPIRYGYKTTEYEGYEAILHVPVLLDSNYKNPLIGRSVDAKRIRMKFKLDIKNPNSYAERIVFQPGIPVLEDDPDKEFLYDLAVMADESQFIGSVRTHTSVKGTIPVRVYGEPRTFDLHDRHKELASLDRLILLLGLENSKDVQELREKLPKIPTPTIRKHREWLFADGVELQEAESKSNMFWANIYDGLVVLLKTIRWADNVALSIVIRYLCLKHQPPLDHDLIEAVVMPLKEFYEDWLADLSVYYIWDDKFPELTPERFIDKADAILQNLLMNDAKNAVNWKELARAMVYSAIASTLKHSYKTYAKYSEDPENSGVRADNCFWLVLRGVFKDMTINVFKLSVTKLCQKWISKDDPVKTYIGIEKMEESFNRTLANILRKGNGPGFTETNQLMELYGKMVIDLISDLAQRSPDLFSEEHDKALDWGLDKASDAAYAGYDIDQSFWDTENSFWKGKLDVLGYWEVKTAEHGSYKIPTVLALAIFVDAKLKEWGIEKLMPLIGTSIDLPEVSPMIYPKESAAMLRAYGMEDAARMMEL